MQATQKSLTLVVGAGASAEAGLPLGSDLRMKIASLLDIRYEGNFRPETGDILINEAFRIIAKSRDGGYGNIDPYLRASWRIRDAMPQAISIDNFIDAHREDQMIATAGKLAIVRSILMAEKSSSLYIDNKLEAPQINFLRLHETWFNPLFQLLTENCAASDLEERFSKVGVICFNYDRCIEHYLLHSLINYYGMSPQSAAAALSNLEIYHPYGMTGQLPWIDHAKGFPFGHQVNAEELIRIAGQILTFTESSNIHESHIMRIREILGLSERIVFLGFAFHRLNMDLLSPQSPQKPLKMNRSAFSTGVGISSTDSEIIKKELFSTFGIAPKSVHISKDSPCSSIFHEYRRSLSLN